MSRRRKPEADPLTTLLSGLFLLLVGVFVGVDYVSEAREEQRIVAEGVRTAGTITDVRFESGVGKHRGSAKVVDVSYSDDSRRRYSVTYRDGYPKKPAGSKDEIREKLLGKEVAVFYDPADTDSAVVEGEASSVAGAYRWGVGVGFFGLLFALLGAWEMKKKREKRTAAKAKSSEVAV